MELLALGNRRFTSQENKPAFLDLADSALEEQKLMGSPAIGSGPMNPVLSLIGGSTLQHHPGISAPTTPPRTKSALHPLLGSRAIRDNDIASALSHGLAPGSRLSNSSLFSSVSFGTPQSAFYSPANTTEKRKSVNYADYTEYTIYSPDASATHAHTVTMPSVSQFGFHTHTAGPKSMPGSRCGSGNCGRDIENGASGIFGATASQPPKGFNPGFLLEEELDEELSRDMHKSVNFLPLSSEDDSKSLLRSDSYSKLSASSVALDLAPLSQTPPRGPGPNGRIDPVLKSSEWPQFSGAPRPSDAVAQPRIRNATNPGPIGGSRPSSGMGRNSSSPTGIPEGSIVLNALAKSVPATPMSSRQSVGSLAGKPVGLGGGDVASFAQEPNGSFNMNRLSGAYDAPVTFSSIQGNKENFVGNMNGEMNGTPAFGSYEYGGGARNGAQSGSTALYQHNGSRYEPALGNGRFMSQENANNNNKMGGLHGTKHKRGDIDREFNRFAGTRLEDLVGEIPALCKDQHGCRYLQKKLEEGVPEHRDIIFRETFSLFAELMTGKQQICSANPFGNYLCQKLLEYSTDEQRNMICESVAHDLVGISLNMHGTRAVQKMIDFLSTQRQANPSSYDVQIHSIITALSMHVVTLVKDLNGNHVVQKCLNRLIPEDNQTALDYTEPTQRTLLVEGIRPILPLIRNTPYGKRIQSKLQREQMESHYQQYSDHNFNQYVAIANLAAMNGNGMSMGNRHVSQPSIHHSPLADAYSRPDSYNMPQQMHPGLQQQPMEHYSMPRMIPSNLTSTTLS
ncbi:hypothetical protein FRC07_014822 [Ceratobasidium sp. 392]|nr:hypothetical protein FRC07_014822 [Ceratobasidium sp. 392]